jgi:ribosomal-protein-alanine N-acetyltransferase
MRARTAGRNGARRVGGVDVPPIRGERVELVSMTPSAIDALLDGRRDEAATELGIQFAKGWPDDHDAGFLRLRLGQMRARPEIQEWAVRALTFVGDERPFAGHLGFHGPPGVNALRRDDAVELGYRVMPAYRRQGYATEAVRALIDWAHRDRGIGVFVASISPQNEPSLALVRRLGFVHVGEHWDEEDGLEHEYLLELSSG